MLLILEILMLIAGLMMLIKKELPKKLVNILFGKGDYNPSPEDIKRIGISFILPMPIAVLFGIVVGLILQVTWIAWIFEIVLIFSVYFWSKKILKQSINKAIKDDIAYSVAE